MQNDPTGFTSTSSYTTRLVNYKCNLMVLINLKIIYFAADVESVEVHMSKKKKKVILTRKSVNVSEESSRKNAAVALYDRKPRKISRITTAWFPSYA